MQVRVVPEIGMLRAMWRELETGPRITLTGHEGGNSGYRQGASLRVTAPALDPTRSDRMLLLCLKNNDVYQQKES